MNAQQIHRALQAAIGEDHWVDGHCDAKITVGPHRIVLEGLCDRLSAKRRIVAVAEALAGDRRVVDRIRRAGVDARGDVELAHAVARRLRAEPAFAACEIAPAAIRGAAPADGAVAANGNRASGNGARGNGATGNGASGDGAAANAGAAASGDGSPRRIGVAARGGAVELTGTVGSVNERRFAEVLAWRTPGCALVDNRLDVDPPRRDSDRALNDAVRMAIDGDPVVDPAYLHFDVAAGIVQLEGVVIDARQRERVLEDVWTVPGVWDVDDRLQLDGG